MNPQLARYASSLALCLIGPTTSIWADTAEEIAQIERQRLYERRAALLPVWQKYSQDLLRLQDSLAARGDFVRARQVAQERSTVLARVDPKKNLSTENEPSPISAYATPGAAGKLFSKPELVLTAEQAKTTGNVSRRPAASSVLLTAAQGVRLNWEFPALPAGRYRVRLHAACLAREAVQARLVLEGHAPLPLTLATQPTTSESWPTVDLGEIQLSTVVRTLRLEMAVNPTLTGHSLEFSKLVLKRENPLK